MIFLSVVHKAVLSFIVGQDVGTVGKEGVFCRGM